MVNSQTWWVFFFLCPLCSLLSFVSSSSFLTTSQIQDIYHETKRVETGKVATYIPQLARVNPDYFGISVCTVDGQRFDIGDTDIPFSAQSTSKPITYAIACELRGEEHVHNHVGREPSGRNFNELVLNPDSLPHNPLINSGAIMCASLIKPESSMAEVRGKWAKMSF